LKRADAKRRVSHKPQPAQPTVPIVTSGRVIQLSLDRDQLLGLMENSLESLALKLGMLVASSLLEDEVTRLCGPWMSASLPRSRACPTRPTRTPRGPLIPPRPPPRPASASPPAPYSPAVTASSRRWAGAGWARSTAPTT
jgi:hypothetical protein